MQAKQPNIKLKQRRVVFKLKAASRNGLLVTAVSLVLLYPEFSTVVIEI